LDARDLLIAGVEFTLQRKDALIRFYGATLPPPIADCCRQEGVVRALLSQKNQTS